MLTIKMKIFFFKFILIVQSIARQVRVHKVHEIHVGRDFLIFILTIKMKIFFLQIRSNNSVYRSTGDFEANPSIKFTLTKIAVYDEFLQKISRNLGLAASSNATSPKTVFSGSPWNFRQVLPQ